MGALTIPFQYADSLPLVPEHDDEFAHIVNIATGEHVDTAYNFDTAINYIQDGEHVAVALRDWTWLHDGTLRATQAEVQAAFDRERRLFEDCFGVQAVV